MVWKVILCLLLVGCTSTKKLLEKKTKTDTVSTESGTVKSTRAGDTLTYTVLNPVLKDTTIYVKNTEKSGALRIAYDSKGKQTIDCITNEIDELKSYVKDAIEHKEEEVKSKEVERGFKDIYILYLFLGLALLLFLNKKLR